MPTWLSDPSTGFYLVLFVLVVITVMVWARNRTRGDLVRAVAVIALLVLLFVFDALFESPREASINTVTQISNAVNERNWDKLRDGLSDRFTYQKYDKDSFVEQVRAAVDRYGPRTAVWDFKPPDDLQPAGPGEYLLQFEGKAERDGSPFMAHFVGTFVEDPDGRWRLKSFTAYNYVQKRSPIQIPGIQPQ
jgi:hypothetical protein